MSVEAGHLAPEGRVGMVGCCGRDGCSFGLEPRPAEHGSQLPWGLLVACYLEWVAPLLAVIVLSVMHIISSEQQRGQYRDTRGALSYVGAGTRSGDLVAGNDCGQERAYRKYLFHCIIASL